MSLFIIMFFSTLQVNWEYLLSPSCRLKLRNETRVKLSAKECESLEREMLSPVKFPTECFLLTAQCSYVCWSSLMRRHQGLLNEARSLQASLASLEAEHNRSASSSQVRGKVCRLSLEI